MSIKSRIAAFLGFAAASNLAQEIPVPRKSKYYPTPEIPDIRPLQPPKRFSRRWLFSSRYRPHQGERECARRRQQLERGIILP